MRLTERERALLQSFEGLELPRHTSYPPVLYWDPEPKRASQVMDRVLAGEQVGVSPLPAAAQSLAELYVHIPFCEAQCSYCGCNRLTLPRASDTSPILRRTLSALVQEIDALQEVEGLRVCQVHFGGGTPNYLSGAELGVLMGALARSGRLAERPRFSVEIDARNLRLSFLSALKDAGFAQASIGVQDLDPAVQKLMNREQTLEQIAQATVSLRKHGVRFINFDLIYGLPGQTLKSWSHTLEQCLSLQPSRFSIFRLALLPERFPWQRGLAALSRHHQGSLTTADLFFLAKETLEAAGYLHIGLDHFARPDDPLALALAEGRLGRSFQGYVEPDRVQTIGLGPSALTFFRGVYAQRLRSVHAWLEAHASENDSGSGRGGALLRGWERSMVLSARDAQQFRAIQAVYTRGSLSRQTIAEQGSSSAFFPGHPVREFYLGEQVLAEDGDGGLYLTPRLGRLLARLVASHLDDYCGSSEVVSKKRSSCPAALSHSPRHSAAF